MTLAELRQAREMTQAQLGEALDLTQPGVSRIEHQTDLYLSTLRSYIAALGGQLEVIARFQNVEIPIRQFERLDAVALEASTGKVLAAFEAKAAGRSLDQAMNQIRKVLEADRAHIQRVAIEISTVALDTSALEELTRSIQVSTETALRRIRENVLALQAPEITQPSEGGWEIKVTSSSGEEAVVSLRTKKDAVKIGQVMAQSTGGKFEIAAPSRASKKSRRGTRARRASSAQAA
jgi:transcriptional regulator with XRE-family HTH domain